MKIANYILPILLVGCTIYLPKWKAAEKEIVYLTQIAVIDTIDSYNCLYFTSGVVAICNNDYCDSTRSFRPHDALGGYLTSNCFVAPVGAKRGRIVKIKRIHTTGDLAQSQKFNYDR